MHTLLAYIGDSTIKDSLDLVDGLEMLRVIEEIHGKCPAPHCDACAENKVTMPACPKGKTTRPTRTARVVKMYADLSGRIEESSIYHNYEYYLLAVTDVGYLHTCGLKFKCQSLFGLAKIFNEAGGSPVSIQEDSEGALNSKIDDQYFNSRQTHKIKSEAGIHWKNGPVERRHSLLKGIVRAMLDWVGINVRFCFFAICHAVLVCNLILREKKTDPGCRREVTVWKRCYGVRPTVTQYLLAPFGCLAYLILSAEERQERGYSKHWGVRSIPGIYLGCYCHPQTLVYSHFITDGRSIFSSSN